MNNDKQIIGFIKRASQAGVPVEGIKQLVAQKFGSVEKQASQPEVTLDSVVTSLLANGGFQKSAQATGYVHGLLTEAIDAGATFSQAVKIAESALVESKRAVTKQAAVKDNTEFAVYAEGFLKAALDAGYSDSQAKSLLTRVVHQKQANAGMMDPAMFKGAVPDMAPQGGMPDMGGMPPQGGMPDMGGMGGEQDPAAMQQLQQAIMAMLSGQGGQQPPASIG